MKKRKEEKSEETSQEDYSQQKDIYKLSKALIREFNNGSDEKIAWSLATDRDNPTEVTEFISTGSTLLDYTISNRRDGGVPVGKLTEICGEEATGKSLICAHLIANCQKRGGIAIYIDTENAANPEFMKRVGVDLNSLVYLQPGTIEEVGATIEKSILAARTKAPGKLVVIIWDSVAGTPSQAEIEGTYDPNDRIGVTAKALAKMMRKLTQTWGKERIAMIFTNQLKVKIGVMYGDPMTTPGGKAIPYHASVRVRLTRSAELKETAQNDSTNVQKGETYGIHTYAKVIKSRLGPPLRKCEFDIMFADGVDDMESWFNCLHGVGEIEKAGGWCYLTSLPSGKIHPTRGVDSGVQFRESGWKELLEDEKIKKHVLDLLEKRMIISYDNKHHGPSDIDLDPESLLDNEAMIDSVSGATLLP